MVYIRKCYYVALVAVLCAISLCSSCQSKNVTEKILLGTPKAQAETVVSPLDSLDRSSSNIGRIRETRKPEDYDVLRDAKEYLDYDQEYNSLYLYIWRIESFDFLKDFPEIKSLSIVECYIPEGLTIPSLEVLDSVVEIKITNNYGSGAVDVLSDCLPLPNLEILSLSGEVRSQSILPEIPSLTDLFISVPNAIEVISNNTQINGSLQFGNPHITTGYETVESLSGIEQFSNIQYLTLPHSVSDLSPLSGCTGLRILDAAHCRQIDTLKPLYELKNLEEIIINENAYNALPETDRKRFSPDHNGDVDAVHVYGGFVSSGYSDNEDESLTLSGQQIDSFDFLREYPNLKYLCIMDCDISDGLVLPKIDTLTYLEVYDSKVLEIIKNNTQLSGRLCIGTGYPSYDEDEEQNIAPLTGLEGLEAFTSLESLTVRTPVHDISALSGCANLRELSIVNSPTIDTLEPIFGLRRLRALCIDPYAFRALPQEEQERFDNRKPYLVHIEWQD